MSRSHHGDVIVTGADGFVGKRLCETLIKYGASVVRVSRTSPDSVGDIDGDTDWSPVLGQGSTIVHLAARAHVLDSRGAQDLAAYRRVNVAGTRRLALQAAAAGVRRLLFVSSIGVLGTHTNGRPAFSATDRPSPTEAYAISKWEAEQALWHVAANCGLEVCIIRPTLVYGPGAVGNFGRLHGLVRKGVLLPLGAVDNRRSLIALDNLVDLIKVCAFRQSAAGGTFLAADGESVSTPELIRGIAEAMGKRARLFPVPISWLRMAGRAAGKSSQIERLIGSLEVDIAHTRNTVNWSPPIDMKEGLRRAVRC